MTLSDVPHTRGVYHAHNDDDDLDAHDDHDDDGNDDDDGNGYENGEAGAYVRGDTPEEEATPSRNDDGAGRWSPDAGDDGHVQFQTRRMISSRAGSSGRLPQEETTDDATSSCGTSNAGLPGSSRGTASVRTPNSSAGLRRQRASRDTTQHHAVSSGESLFEQS